MKAQSAIEYLMTYGWMLITVAVIGGSMYSVTNTQCVESTSGFAGEDLQITDYGKSSDNSLDLVVENRGNEEIKVNSVRVSSAENNTSATISVSSKRELSVPDFIESDSCNTLDVEIDYDAGNLQNLEASGTLTGQYETEYIATPSIHTVTQ